jgi:hypothetical protein
MFTVFVQCFRAVQWPYGSPHTYPCLLDLFSVSEESTCVVLVLMNCLLSVYIVTSVIIQKFKISA